MKNMNQNNLREQKKSAEDQNSQPQKTEENNPSNSMGLLAQVTTLAWNLVIPIVGGVLLGHYIDNRSGDGFTWTLSLLVLGVIIAFSNLYNLYIEHGQKQIKRENKKNANEDSHEEE